MLRTHTCGELRKKDVGKKVIAPKTWFGDHLSRDHDTKDLIPDNWIKI